MTEQFLADYFTNVAAVVKDISHTVASPSFYRMQDANDLDEFDNAVKTMAKDLCLLLEIGSGDIGEWDTQADMPRIGLHVLVKTTDAFNAINTARDQAKATLLKILSLMRTDCKTQYERLDGLDGPLKAVNVVFDSKIKFSNMTAVDGNWYGKSFYFTFRVPLNIVYNPADYY